jgi:arsenate reductase (thioredoxin)
LAVLAGSDRWRSISSDCLSAAFQQLSRLRAGYRLSDSIHSTHSNSIGYLIMKKVMFVCKKNSARSQMAEGFAKKLGSDKFAIASSGLESSQVNPIAIQVMQEVGIDISGQESTALHDYRPEDFDIVISLCGCGVNLPPDWLQQEVFEDWQLDDPAEQLEIFPRVRDEVQARVIKLIESYGSSL